MDFANIICVFLSILTLHPGLGQDEETVDSKSPTFLVKISPEQQDQMINVGANRIYTCMASAANSSQEPVLHWEVNDIKITATSNSDRIRIENLSNGNLRLRIEGVKYGDEGLYKCVGTLGVQTDSRSFRFEVFEEIEVNSPTSQFGIHGQTGIVSCNATGNPAPTLTWRFANNTNIEDATGEKYLIQGIQMVIKNLQFEDAGNYLCDATVVQTGGNKLTTISFEIIKVPVIEEDPSISPSQPKIGDDVTVTCQADGVPEPTYQFKKGDSFLSDDQVDKLTGVLTITNLQQEDETDYVCIATNRGGSDEKSIFLDVKIPPTILDMPKTTEAVENDQKLVTCLAEGDPAPTVTWRKEGQDIYDVGSPDDGLEVSAEIGSDGTNRPTGKTLNFASIKPQDAGTYTCTAINIVGSKSESITLEVKYKPNFNTNFKETDFYGWEGHTANLTCLASGNEPANIKWSKVTIGADNVQIQTEGPYMLNPPQKWPQHHLSSSSILIAVGSDDSVYGDYICEADNSLGVTTQTVRLIEAVPPEAPRVKISNVLSTMVTLEVQTPENNGGQPVLGYYFTYHQTNDSTNSEEKYADASPDITYVDLRNLVAKTSYIAKVRAHNAVGRGMEYLVPFDTKEVSRPIKLNMTSPRVGSESTSYQVVWSEPDNGGVAITQYLIKYKEVSVIDEDADEWRADGETENKFVEITVKDANARSYVIPNLKRSSFYEIYITATNKEGESNEEIKIVKTSEGGSVQVGQAGSAGLGSGAVIGIVIGLLILIVIIAVIISLVFKKKPELVERLRGLGGKGGEEERGKSEDGKDPAEEEKLIKKDDTVKVENEIEEGKPEQVMEEHHEEFEPDSKPEAPSSPDVGAKNGTAEKPPELSTPAPTTEIKITPETPEKPEDPPA